MVSIRWHDTGVLGVPSGTSAKQAAMGFARLGLRLQAEGISPAPIEATLTITDKHGLPVGQPELEAADAQGMVDAINGMLKYGPWRSEDADRLLAEYSPSKPG